MNRSAKTPTAAVNPAAQREPLRTIVETIVQIASPKRVILFGSRAKGTAGQESDYDLLVVVPFLQNEREVSRRVYRALLEKKVGAAVDLIVVGARTLQQHATSPYFIYRQALDEGKVLYEYAGV
jgi:predicted nucleotidyltransferase